MFGFKKKECSCGESNIVWTDIIPSFGGNVEVHYCQKCSDRKMAEQLEKHKENERKAKEAEAERAKNDYYLWLKREVEIKELEIRAKELGIDVRV